MGSRRGYVSVSVLADAIETGCLISAAALYFLQKSMREERERAKPAFGPAGSGMSAQKGRSPRIHEYEKFPASNRRISGGLFHEKYFSLLKKDRERKSNDPVASALLNLKDSSDGLEIKPEITSPEYLLIGQPDVIFCSQNSIKIVEMKNKSKCSKSDELQAESYALMLADPKSCISPEIRYKGKTINAYLLNSKGKLKKVKPQNKNLIKSKALEVLEVIRMCGPDYMRLGSLDCDSFCENAAYCSSG